MGFCLVPMLAGCITAERPELAVDIPPAYRAARGAPAAAPPALDWWRGFRSTELTKLIEEAQTANFDIAAAIARIVQADAQSKIAGAPLLPAVDFSSSASRSRSSQAGGSNAVSGAAADPSARFTTWRSTPATRSISGARTARSRAPRRKTPSPPASTATSSS